MRRSPALLCLALPALWAAAGCRKDALQKPDASGGGIGGIDAATGDGGLAGDSGAGGGFGDGGGAIDARGAMDSRWDVTFGSRRSFVVTSQVLFAVEPTGAASHAFTMTLDSDTHSAIVGTSGSASLVRVEQTSSGALRFLDPVSFGIDVPAPCGASVRYDDLSFTVDGSGYLVGNGGGMLTTYRGPGMTTTFGASMRVTGVPDTEPPTFALSAGGDLADPWAALYFVSSEPLPGQQMRPVLRSASGDALAFGAPTGMDAFVAVLAKPVTMLRFAEAYRVTVDGITDLAGNFPAPADLSFTTRPAPPLVAPDGFESVTDPMLAGARVLSGAGAPVITGTRSLYVAPVASLGGGAQVTQMALRLPVAPGATVLRLSYQVVNPGDPTVPTFLFGSVGGTIGSIGPTMQTGSPTTRATIDGTEVTVGQRVTTFAALSADTGTEVVLALIATQASSCGAPPPPPVPGLILDDVRTE